MTTPSRSWRTKRHSLESDTGVTADDKQEPVKAAAPATILSDEAYAAVKVAQDALAAGRRTLMALRADLKVKRGALGQVIMEWQRAGNGPVSRDDLVREHLLSNQRERERNGPNRRQAVTAKHYTQKQMINRGNRRGAYSQLELARMPKEQRAAIGQMHARMRGERPKLPSER